MVLFIYKRGVLFGVKTLLFLKLFANSVRDSDSHLGGFFLTKIIWFMTDINLINNNNFKSIT